MTEDILVSVKGFHSVEGMEEEDEIEVVTPGKYFQKNGKHYIFYEEKIEGSSETIKNRITLKNGCLEIQKKGPVVATLIFEKGKKNSSTYQTPYGPMLSTVNVTKMFIDEQENRILAKIDYELELNYEHAANSHIEISIINQGDFRLN